MVSLLALQHIIHYVYVLLIPWRLHEGVTLQSHQHGTMVTSSSGLDRYTKRYVQWNPSNPDTLGTEECVLISEVFGTAKCVLFIEVSLFQGCPE